MGINEDNAKMFVAEITYLRARSEAIKANLVSEIMKMADNPDVNRISRCPNCFTVYSSVVMRAGKWSPQYFDWLYQYAKVIDKINDTEVLKLIDMLTEAIDNRFIIINKEKILLAPEVINKLKSLL